MAKLVSATYGDALFELAVQESKVDSLYAEATDCLKVFEENSELGRLLNHPKIDKSEKEKVIENAFGQFVSKDLTGLLVLMVSKDRQKQIMETLRYFIGKIREYKKNRQRGSIYSKAADSRTKRKSSFPDCLQRQGMWILRLIIS